MSSRVDSGQVDDEQAERPVDEGVEGHVVLRTVARAGLLARMVFYALLAYLAVRLAIVHSDGKQADANGALSIVGGSALGTVALVVATAGFVILGLARLRGAVRDTAAPRTRRMTTALQGLATFGVAYVPAQFVAGHGSTGSEQQTHRETTQVLNLPFGRALLVLGGLVLLTVCAWQVRTALSGDFSGGLATEDSPRWVRRVTRIIGAVGIAGRALVLAPLGVFVIYTAAESSSRNFKGLDGQLLTLAQHGWGRVVLSVIALLLLDFAAYSGVEARFRRVASGS